MILTENDHFVDEQERKDNPASKETKLALHPIHYQDLQKSELSDETIKAAGIYSVTPSDISKKLGWNGQGVESLLAFPYLGCDRFERYKPFYHPEYQGKKPKYLQKKDSGNYLIYS